MNKLKTLKRRLASHGKAAVAFSGGADSTFLLLTAVEVLGPDNVLPLTAVTPFVPSREIDRAERVSEAAGRKCLLLEMDLLAEPVIAGNPPDRCYHCKKAIFSRISAAARAQGFAAVLEGSNTDDLDDYRPGMRALTELGIESPLKTAGFSKREIRAQLKAAGFPDWDLPASACLASRIPYNTPITPASLRRIEAAETLLRDKGFTQIRVRDHGSLARIEPLPADLVRFSDPALSAGIARALKELGFTYITVDLEGYRTGSLNAEVLGNE
ncbi:ATP-dependent sacrificial sulfur transferase LarE [bacterium]|nr:ATP-dependent sacrificial sulfur transferase LarE [bacterium]